MPLGDSLASGYSLCTVHSLGQMYWYISDLVVSFNFCSGLNAGPLKDRSTPSPSEPVNATLFAKGTFVDAGYLGP